MVEITYDPIVRGDSAQIALQLLQEDILTQERSLVDLTGAVVSLIAHYADDTSTTWTSQPNAGLAIQPEHAIAVRDLAPEETQALPVGPMQVRWRVTYSNGRTETLADATLDVRD